METNFEIQKEVQGKLNWELIQNATRSGFETVQRERKIFFKTENATDPNVKPEEGRTNDMEVVCAMLKNDLGWHHLEKENNSQKLRIAIRKGATTKGFSREIADKLTEKWWLNS